MHTFKLFGTRSHIPKKSRLNILFDHILAAIVPLTGLSISLILGLEKSPALIFLPMIAASAWIGGLSAGILTSLISVILLNYFGLSSSTNQSIYNSIYILQSVLFAAEGVFLSFIIDILKHRERIKEYKKREKELNDQIKKLEELNKNFEKEIKTRNEFLSIASHELKTPLTSMLLQTQSALHNIKNVSVAKFSFESLLKMLHSVENQTQRLSKMINDLLSVSTITSGHLELVFEQVNLEKLIKGVLDDFGARIEKEKIKVTFTAPDDIIGSWDKIRIEQAISNFISNAIKYGNKKPIDVTMKKKKNNAEITVTDQGIGIVSDKQKSIFELFSRGVPAEKYKGLGVGLYITQKIIHAHGGRIEVKSKLNKGSEFKIILPIKKPKN